VYLFVDASSLRLIDLDSATGCGDGQQDFLMTAGPCEHPKFPPQWTGFLDLTNVSPPLSVCVARFPSIDGFLTLNIVDFDAQSLRYQTGETILWSFRFDSGLRKAPRSRAAGWQTYTLRIFVTTTPAETVQAEKIIPVPGESILRFLEGTPTAMAFRLG